MNEFEQINKRLDRLEKLTLLSAKNILCIDELVLLTGISKGRLYHLVNDNIIPYSKPQGKLYFDKSEIEKWMMSSPVRTNREISSEAATYCKTH